MFTIFFLGGFFVCVVVVVFDCVLDDVFFVGVSLLYRLLELYLLLLGLSDVELLFC